MRRSIIQTRRRGRICLSQKDGGYLVGLSRNKMASLRDWLWEQKFRFERGQQFLVFVNFGLLMLIASNQLKTWGLPRWAVYLMIPIGFFGMWLFGWFVVEKARGYAKDEAEQLKRSPAWEKHETSFRQIDEILRIVRGDGVASGGVGLGNSGMEVQDDRKPALLPKPGVFVSDMDAERWAT